MHPTVGCIYNIKFFCDEAHAAKTAAIRRADNAADLEDAFDVFDAHWTKWMPPCACLKCAEVGGLT